MRAEVGKKSCFGISNPIKSANQNNRMECMDGKRNRIPHPLRIFVIRIERFTKRQVHLTNRLPTLLSHLLTNY